jgi:phosphoribosyl 1,2-cyclic phosphate phosphodiesterase
MKIQYWGTAAAEGIPAIFCGCSVCNEARRLGGKYARARSQVMLDDELLVDFGPDTYMNSVRFGHDLSRLSDVLITHVHEDHFYPSELLNRSIGYSNSMKTDTLVFHGSEDVERQARHIAGSEGIEDLLKSKRIAFDKLLPYEKRCILGFSVTPIPANHDTPNPYIYIFEKNRKNMLLFNDSAILSQEAFDFIKESGIKFDLVSYDCTYADRDDAKRHLGIPDVLRLRKIFTDNGNYKDSTIEVITHFSHNTKTVGYGDMKKIADSCGLVLAYDGLEIEF